MEIDFPDELFDTQQLIGLLMAWQQREKTIRLMAGLARFVLDRFSVETRVCAAHQRC